MFEEFFPFSCWIFYFQVAIESVLLIQDPKVARQVMFQNPPAKARMVSRGCVVWGLCSVVSNSLRMECIRNQSRNRNCSRYLCKKA